MNFSALSAKEVAIATVIGQFAAMACVFTFHQLFNKDLRLFCRFHPDKSILIGIYKIGLPAIFMQAIGSVSDFMMNGGLANLFHHCRSRTGGLLSPTKIPLHAHLGAGKRVAAGSCRTTSAQGIKSVLLADCAARYSAWPPLCWPEQPCSSRCPANS